MRVLFDTNVYISLALKPRSVSGEAIAKGFLNHEVVASRTLISELHAKLLQPKFASYVTVGDVREILDLLELGTIIVEPTERIEACRDPKDNHVLEAAISGGVLVIVTGDKDLLVLNPFRDTVIVSPARFLTLV